MNKRAGEKSRPYRPKFFAVKFIRKMVKECLAQEVGQLGMLLLIIIVTTEDAAGYRRSVSFYDEQLLPLLGVGSKSSISIARKRCVEAGWLHFEPGRRGKASRYWVTIPLHADDVDDYPTDEGHDELIDTINIFSSERIPNESQTNPERNSNETRTLLPIPNPLPHPTRADEGLSASAKRRQQRQSPGSLLSQELVPPQVAERLVAYTYEVIVSAWKVARHFNDVAPDPSRRLVTVQKIVRQFCETIARNKAAAQRLEDYYALDDAEQWQREVDAGTRKPPGEAPLNVCNFLFPPAPLIRPGKTKAVPYPTAEELQQQRTREHQELLAKEAAHNV